ncbi:MAG: hypothetical protein Q9171_002812, partial [Xanthocarpia ochracea]
MTDPREILNMRASESLLGKRTSSSTGQTNATSDKWMQRVTERISTLAKDYEGDQVYHILQKIGIAALDSFLQSNVTGPPLQWDSAEVIFHPEIADDPQELSSLRQALIQDLSVDGEAVYQLTPNIELFCLAKCILNHPASLVPEEIPGYLDSYWARVTVNFWHQKLLNENAASLQQVIYEDLDHIEEHLRSRTIEDDAARLIQRATIHTQHGFDNRAREDLQRATRTTGFEFELTGRLGKRTKFQENELSQLVVLARSADDNHAEVSCVKPSSINGTLGNVPSMAPKPDELNLNDDTLLESIAFSKPKANPFSVNGSNVSLPLENLDPSDQPPLNPLDSIILLAYASSITNTSPSDGLTREETLPYATRVLQGSSINWQIYTQALLVRSRIEGYRSRTIERGVLQMQALVDQVIVETTPAPSTALPSTPSIQIQDVSGTSSFLPRPKPSESAPARERLAYIHQLASPTRWELEAELASRWVSLGGLRTALEIYERLQMWAEVALCWAANDREDKARMIIRRQLYTSAKASKEPRQNKPTIDDDEVSVDNLTVERMPLPADAPRLLCILGDLEQSPSAYEKAWDVSNHRYGRAQRSLGKYYFRQGDLQKADDAYAKSLKVNALNHSTWFSLGCIRLQSGNWTGAVDAFGRAIQIEDKDAESWSNMAAALIQLPAEANVNGADIDSQKSLDYSGEDDDDISDTPKANPQKHIRSAFVALKRAAALKRESHRIWQNLLNVAVKLSPPPYTDIIIAQTRLIDLRGKAEGENCIDIEVMEGLLAHLIAISPSPGLPPATQTAAADENVKEMDGRSNGTRMGFENMLITLLQSKITPLITTSRRLHLLVAKLALHLRRPAAALEAYEKAWRCTLNTSGWENGTNDTEAEEKWRAVVDATVELVDGYESLGERMNENGRDGEVVEKGWRFKGR